MNESNILDKVVPAIILAIILGLMAMYIQTEENSLKIKGLKKFDSDTFKHVLKNHDDIIVLQETVRCMKKEPQ